jgi:hypothetical protein
MLKTALLIGTLLVTGQTPEPTLANFVQWRDYIRPKAQELSFESLDWKATFWEAVVEAQRTGKPILLWAMNGHPMACT